MCRHLAVLSQEPVAAAGLLLDEPHALRQQSCCDRRGEKHADGWGVGYYRPTEIEPYVVRFPTDAATDDTFVSTARQLQSNAWIAHVRQASVGVNSEANCHPFHHGAWLFAHNGTVTDFEQIGPRLEANVPADLLALRQGTTDSELVFVRLLAKLRTRGIDLNKPTRDVQPLIDVIAETLRELAAWSAEFPPREETKFNFLLTDGTVLAASRWNHDLHWLVRPGAVIVASEPIGPGAWKEVPEHSILSIDATGQTRSDVL